MGSRILKVLIILFFAGVVAFSAMTFLATDLDAEIVYHKKHKVYKNGEYMGIECHGEGTTCKINISKGIPDLIP